MTEFTRVTPNRCTVSVNKRKASPVVNDKGEFFLSASMASKHYKIIATGVSSAMARDGRAAQLSWRFATFDECLKQGIEVPKGMKIPKAVRVAAKKADLMKADLSGDFPPGSVREIQYDAVDPTKKRRGRPPGSKSKPRDAALDATFNAVTWPDGAVTVRLNHGNTWTMTRKSKDEIPPEMLHDCVWVAARAEKR